MLEARENVALFSFQLFQWKLHRELWEASNSSRNASWFFFTTLCYSSWRENSFKPFSKTVSRFACKRKIVRSQFRETQNSNRNLVSETTLANGSPIKECLLLLFFFYFSASSQQQIWVACCAVFPRLLIENVWSLSWQYGAEFINSKWRVKHQTLLCTSIFPPVVFCPIQYLWKGWLSEFYPRVITT